MQVTVIETMEKVVEVPIVKQVEVPQAQGKPGSGVQGF